MVTLYSSCHHNECFDLTLAFLEEPPRSPCLPGGGPARGASPLRRRRPLLLPRRPPQPPRPPHGLAPHVLPGTRHLDHRLVSMAFCHLKTRDNPSREAVLESYLGTAEAERRKNKRLEAARALNKLADDATVRDGEFVME